MPKRHGKAYRDFLSGMSAGKNVTRIGTFVRVMRQRKKLTIDEFALGCGLSVKQVHGIEAEDVTTFLKLSSEHLTQIAKFCDVALSLKMTAMDDTLAQVPASFQEETDKVFKLIGDFCYGKQYVWLLKKVSVPCFMVNLYTNTREPQLLVSTSVPEEDFDQAVSIYRAHIDKIIADTSNTDLLDYLEHAPTLSER